MNFRKNMESKIWKNLKVRILTITKPTRGPNGWRRLVLSFTKLGSLKAHCGTFIQKDCKPYLFFWVDGKPYFEPKYNVKLKVIKILIVLRDNSCVCVYIYGVYFAKKQKVSSFYYSVYFFYYSWV